MMNLTMKRSDANNFELSIHYAEEEVEESDAMEKEIIKWMQAMLKKYSKEIPNEL